MNRVAIPVCLQIVTGLATGTMIEMDWATEGILLLFIATGFSQCALLAIWGSIARLSRSKRVLRLVCGTIYLWLLVMYALGRPKNALEQWVASFCLVTCPVSALTAVLTVAKKWRPGFELVRKASMPGSSGSLQFSLRHIMAFAVVVSVALTAGRILRAMQMSETLAVAIMCGIVAGCITASALAALSATLSCGRITARIGAATAMALLTGLIPPFYFDWQRSDYLSTSLLAFEAQSLTIATLLVARASGYRLVRRLAPQVESQEPAELAGHPLD